MALNQFIPDDHLHKINKAIDLCTEVFTAFTDLLDKKLPEKEALEMTNFLTNNTYFAGGMFRSIFTDTEINDIDVFFKSKKAADKFKHTFLKPNKIFSENDITKNHTFKFKLKGFKPLTFITSNAGTPDEVLNTFDFTFNKHFFDVNSFDMRFDVNTFNKSGFIGDNVSNPLKLYFRALRFLKEGFTIEDQGFDRLALSMLNYNTPDELKLNLDDVQNTENSSGESPKRKKSIKHSRWYTSTDYFQTDGDNFKILDEAFEDNAKTYRAVIEANRMLFPTTATTTTHTFDTTTWEVRRRF